VAGPASARRTPPAAVAAPPGPRTGLRAHRSPPLHRRPFRPSPVLGGNSEPIDFACRCRAQRRSASRSPASPSVAAVCPLRPSAAGILPVSGGVLVPRPGGGAPWGGVLGGLAPARGGEATPPVSPRASEVKFISHHAFPLIAGSLLAAVAIVALTLILLTLLDA